MTISRIIEFMYAKRRKVVTWGIVVPCVIFVILVIGRVIYLRVKYTELLRLVEQRCPEVDLGRYGRDLNFYDCENNIVIDKWWYNGIPIYSLYDIRHDYYITGFKTFELYRLIDDKMYVYNEVSTDQDHSYSIENGKKLYFDEYFIGDKLQTFYYEALEEHPRYFVINTITGEVRFYRYLKDVPQEEQAVFQELEKAYNQRVEVE